MKKGLSDCKVIKRNRLLLVAPFALFACAAEVTGSGSTPGSATISPTGQTPVNATPPACASEIAEQRLFLVDLQSYLNMVRDLLGPDAVSDLARQQAQRTDLFSNGIPTLSDATPYAAAAEYAAATLTGQKLTTFASCGENETCARQALSTFMARAFRRPVEPTEVEALMTSAFAAGAATSFQRGVQLAVEAVLQAGSTLYLKEFGVSKGQGVALLDPYEVASQLSFFLLDSIPDTELASAASAGRLSTAQEIGVQVTRLLAQPPVQSRLTELVLRQYHLDDIRTTTAVDGSYRELFTDSLRNSFYQESSLLVDDVLWKNPRSVVDFVTSKETFINQELADKVYHVPFRGAPGEFTRTTVPGHAAGLLSQGSFLAGKAKANSGSVVKRGKSIRINFLCLGPPPPPPTGDPRVKAKLEEQAASSLSETELAAQRAADPVCKACHATFDPLGLALNQFDRIGRFDASQAASADLSGVDAGFTGITIDGPEALGQKIASDPGFAACMASTVLRFGTRKPSSSSDCEATEAAREFAGSGYRFDALVRAVAASNGFIMRREGANL